MALDQGNERSRRLPEGPRAIAHASLAVFGVIAAIATAVAIIESYSNLLAFALTYGLHGWRAAIAPAAVDSFIIMGELLLFAAILLKWHGWSPYVTGAAMAICGFALSTGGNIWHAPVATAADRAVAALWPVIATAGLAGGLIIAKRLIGRPRTVPRQAPPPAPALRREPPRTLVREARAPEPAAAQVHLSAEQSALELELARELAAAGPPFPGEQRYTRDEPRLGGNRRAGARVLALARSMSNGAGHGDRVGA